MSGEIQIGRCDFCQQEKPTERTYLRPSKYEKPKDPQECMKLFNEGDYFLFLNTCSDCGKPKSE